MRDTHGESSPAGDRPGAAIERTPPSTNLSRYAYLSIAAAVATITLKVIAWRLTGSVGLLSDAAESVVNLVAAVAMLIVLRIAGRPADSNHLFGHTKAGYFSAAIEGQMIFVAALVIMGTAVERFLHPRPIEAVGVGLGISVVASIINAVVGILLIRAGRRHRSMPLTADGEHLMTDVWTSAGVIVGVLLVALTGIQRLDPVIAFAVGLNIVFTGWKLLRASVEGLMDIAMTKQDNAVIADVLTGFVTPEVHFHALRTRESGQHQFAEVHVLVPGAWTVQQGHDLVEDVEAAVHARFPDIALTCHLEPSEDPRAYGDYAAEFPVPNGGADRAPHAGTQAHGSTTPRPDRPGE